MEILGRMAVIASTSSLAAKMRDAAAAEQEVVAVVEDGSGFGAVDALPEDVCPDTVRRYHSPGEHVAMMDDIDDG